MSLPVISTEHKSLEMPRSLYYFLQKSAKTEDANKIFQSSHRVLFTSHTKTDMKAFGVVSWSFYIGNSAEVGFD